MPSFRKKHAKSDKGSPLPKPKPWVSRDLRYRIPHRLYQPPMRLIDDEVEEWIAIKIMLHGSRRYYKALDAVDRAVMALLDDNRVMEAQRLQDRLNKWRHEVV
jgi:hypothetical protein